MTAKIKLNADITRCAQNLSVLVFSLISFAFFCLGQAEATVEPKGKDVAIETAIARANSAAKEDFRRTLGSVVTEEPYTPSEIDSFVRYMPSRSTQGVSGRVSIIESAAEYSYEFKAFGQLPVEFFLANRYVGINNTTEVELPAHLVGLSSGLEATLPFLNLKNTYLRVGVNPNFYSDNWTLRSRSFRISSRYFIIMQPDTKFTFLAGVVVTPGPHGAVVPGLVLPVVGFIYKPNTRWVFNLVPKRPTINYSFNDHLTLFAEGGISSSEFYVPKGNRKGVALDYNASRLGGGLEYKFNKFIQATISAGRVFSRSLKYGDSLGKVTIKPGAYTEFRVVISQ